MLIKVRDLIAKGKMEKSEPGKLSKVRHWRPCVWGLSNMLTLKEMEPLKGLKQEIICLNYIPRIYELVWRKNLMVLYWI